MHLTLVTETFAPEINGVAMTLLRWCGGLARQGHAVTVIRPRQTSDLVGVRALAPTSDLPLEQVLVRGAPLPGYHGLRFGFPCGAMLRRSWRQARPEIVHVATEGPLGWSAVRMARKMGIPVVSSFHTNFHSYGKHYGVGRLESIGLRYLTWLHNQTAATFVPTHEMRSTLRHDGMKGLRVLARGVDTELYHPQRRNQALRESWGLAPGELAIGYVGRLAPEKNIKLAVLAYEALAQQQGRKTRFVLVGDGPSRAGLEKAYPDFIFCGMQRGTALAEHYASLDLLLFPSITETFGNVVTEAMASGLPLIAFDYAAAHRHIVHEICGLLAPFNDGERFVRLAEQVVRQPSAMQAMGRAARQTAQKISWDRVVLKYQRLLQATLRCHRE